MVIGHSFRRTSTTILANTGADMITIKRHGHWRSDAVAQKYIANSITAKKKTEKLISSAIRKEEQTMAVNNCNDNGVLKENMVAEKHTAETLPKKPFKFVPKKKVFSVTPPPYSDESNSNFLDVVHEDYHMNSSAAVEERELSDIQLNFDTLVTEYESDVDIDNYIIEKMVDGNNYVSQQNMRSLSVPMPNNYVFKNCNVTFYVNQ